MLVLKYALLPYTISMEIVLIAHNLRSAHNVGSLLRTADCLGVKKLYLTGYTPYPQTKHDARLPHLSLKIHNQIQKTALGAERTVSWTHEEDIVKTIDILKESGFCVYALEQTTTATALPEFNPPEKIALIVGREVEGLEPEVVTLCQGAVEIPMKGKKESLNVVQAAAIALYHCSFRR
jgi:tRNA G18 (ribose-2'-O)-methylase SpoU